MAKQDRREQDGMDTERHQNPKQAGGSAGGHDGAQHDGSNAQKDPDEWVTGDESMTGAQASYLKTLSEEAGEEFDPELTKADASLKIDELQNKTGRGE